MSTPTNRNRFRILPAWLWIPLLLLAVPAASLSAEEPKGDPPVNIPWGPYLQNLTPTSVTFMWTSNTPNEGVVEYGESKDDLDRRQPAETVLPDEKCRQEATIRDLEPGTIYHYRVTSTPMDRRAAVSSEPGFCANAVLKRRNAPTPDAQIEALDIKTGQGLWQASGGPEIRYCEALDLLCSSNGVYRGSDGERLFGGGVYLIAGDKLVSGSNNQFALLDPQTGKQKGKRLQWNLRGCTRLRGSADLLTTRYMGNAAYVDIESGEITSIWNVRAACSNNLFPADGVLNVPNLSGGCTCNYMPISQALVPAGVVDRLAGATRTGE